MLQTTLSEWPSHSVASLMQTRTQAGPGPGLCIPNALPGEADATKVTESVNYLLSGGGSAQGSPASDAPVPTAAPNQGATLLTSATAPPATSSLHRGLE